MTKGAQICLSCNSLTHRTRRCIPRFLLSTAPQEIHRKEETTNEIDALPGAIDDPGVGFAVGDEVRERLY